MEKVMVADYFKALNKTVAVFGEENVRWYQSEKFFTYSQRLLEDIVTFLGLYPYAGLHKCFKESGNYKKGVEEDLFAKFNINATTMSDHLRSVLVALHRAPVSRLERELHHEFHWFDND